VNPSQELFTFVIAIFALIGFGVTVKFFSDNLMPDVVRWLKRPTVNWTAVIGGVGSLLFGAVFWYLLITGAMTK